MKLEKRHITLSELQELFLNNAMVETNEIEELKVRSDIYFAIARLMSGLQCTGDQQYTFETTITDAINNLQDARSTLHKLIGYKE